MEIEYIHYFKNDVRPLASLSLIELSCFFCPEGDAHTLKEPDIYGLFYVKSGNGVYSLAGKKYPAIEGDIFAAYPDIAASFQANDSEDPCALYSVTFDGIDSRLLLNAANFQPKAPLRHLEDKEAEAVEKIILGLDFYHNQSLYGSILSTATLHLLMSTLIKTASWNPADMPSGWTGTVHFQKAVNYIQNNYSRITGVNDVADHVGLTQSRLFQIFKQQIFMSPQKYIIEYRVREGLNLLEKRTGSVKEIALAVGFEDQLYFTKLVKRKTGKSPTEYMKAKT